MTITLDTVTALAPDQPSLKAASTQMKPAKWPVRARATSGDLVWGECQGSGANPYRVVFDAGDHGYTCTCPSRKFPCKHVLALMWMFAEDPGPFGPAEAPQWVDDWVGRRRKTGAAPKAPKTDGKSLTAARLTEAPPPEDPKAAARRRTAAAKRAQDTQAAIAAAVDDLDQWIADQLRAGLSALSADLTDRCRAIAARMVDGKAAALAGRVDELPARVLALPVEERIDALIAELGKLVLLTRAWRVSPEDPELRRLVATAETREEVLANPEALRVRAHWEVVGTQIATRRDGLVGQHTWLLNLDGGQPVFALLLDFFPASAGRRGGAFVSGDQFSAELVFYLARHPMRAVFAERAASEAPNRPWPQAAAADPLEHYLQVQYETPWASQAPVFLAPGRLAEAGGPRLWWRADDGKHALPLTVEPPTPVRGMALNATVGIWNGARLTLLAARSDWGRLAFDA